MSLPHSEWLQAFRTYLAVTVAANLVWESLQLPLYTIWTTGTAREQAFAVVHCTGGDLLIALVTLVASLLLCGEAEWPGQRFGRVATLTIVFGLAYTGFSEWLNVSVRRSWAYSDWMPVIPVAGGIGLSPLLQWVAGPVAGILGGLARTRGSKEWRCHINVKHGQILIIVTI